MGRVRLSALKPTPTDKPTRTKPKLKVASG